MKYDICMRSIERIEDAIADAWELKAQFPHLQTLGIAGYEALDFENCQGAL
jgi:hypothetical protein